ncbi:MAG: hypothetical protein EPN17_01020 [Methylobacter sp.]|nr:MAG: hypothetical protein EPN17_01020 [Methylobacter sp.]
MTTTTLILAGRERAIAEPVFKQLRRIIQAYGKLADPACSDAEKIEAVKIILVCLLDESINIKRLAGDELGALLQAIPDICGLKPVSPGSKNTGTDWGGIYAYLSAYFGWTYDYIDNYMTLSRLNEYQGYLKKHPPTHELVAAYLGYEYQDKQSGNGFLAAIAAQVKSKQALS